MNRAVLNRLSKIGRAAFHGGSIAALWLAERMRIGVSGELDR